MICGSCGSCEQRLFTAESRRRGGRVMELECQALTEQIIGAAIEVHRALGPGLLESAYQECLATEFEARGIPYEREAHLPIAYRGRFLDCGYRLDFIVAG